VSCSHVIPWRLGYDSHIRSNIIRFGGNVKPDSLGSGYDATPEHLGSGRHVILQCMRQNIMSLIILLIPNVSHEKNNLIPNWMFSKKNFCKDNYIFTLLQSTVIYVFVNNKIMKTPHYLAFFSSEYLWLKINILINFIYFLFLSFYFVLLCFSNLFYLKKIVFPFYLFYYPALLCFSFFLI